MCLAACREPCFDKLERPKPDEIGHGGGSNACLMTADTLDPHTRNLHHMCHRFRRKAGPDVHSRNEILALTLSRHPQTADLLKHCDFNLKGRSDQTQQCISLSARSTAGD